MTSRRAANRGTAYVAVLGLSLLVVTVGMGAMLAARDQLREVNLRNDESEAAACAEATIDWAWQRLHADPAGWRGAYTNNTYTPSMKLGRGTVTFKLVDEGDSSLGDDRLENVRLYALARSGGAARSYSVSLQPTGPTLEVVGFPLYTGDDLTVIGSVRAVGGPVVCADALTVSAGATLDGSAECVRAVTLLGTVTGSIKTGVAPRTLPQTTVYDYYASQAVTISYASLPGGGRIYGRVLTPASNPYGTANPRGVYFVDVPTGGRLSIGDSRLECTLVVNLAPGAQLILSGTYLWEAPGAMMPALVVKAAPTSVISLGGSLTPLSEADKANNFNPPGSPYGGVSDADMTDFYATEVRGLIHIIGCGATLTDDFSLRGVAIIEGSVTMSNGATVYLDSSVQASPPWGYFDPTMLAARPGTYRREDVPLP